MLDCDGRTAVKFKAMWKLRRTAVRITEPKECLGTIQVMKRTARVVGEGPYRNDLFNNTSSMNGIIVDDPAKSKSRRSKLDPLRFDLLKGNFA